MTLLLFLLLTSLHATISTSKNATFESAHFRAVRSVGGKMLCPVNSSSDTVILRRGNMIQCSTQCKSNDTCAAFSYTKQTGQCSFYSCSVPTNLTTVQGCSTYTRTRLDTISQMTTNKRCRLRFDLTDFSGISKYEEYDNFVVANASNWYKLLSVGTPSGTAGDTLTFCSYGPYGTAIGMYWTTYDAQHDNSETNCAVTYNGAWWHNACHCCNPNGVYYQGGTSPFGQGINWYPWQGYSYSMKLMAMKIKPY